MRGVVLVSCVALVGLSCSHPQNPERKDPLTDQVTGALQPTDRVFLKDDPASRVACSADAQCPAGALCYPGKRVCFTSYPEMELTKIEGSCPLVPLYFAYDSTDLVPEAQRWVDYDARCLKERGATPRRAQRLRRRARRRVVQRRSIAPARRSGQGGARPTRRRRRHRHPRRRRIHAHPRQNRARLRLQPPRRARLQVAQSANRNENTRRSAPFFIGFGSVRTVT